MTFWNHVSLPLYGCRDEYMSLLGWRQRWQRSCPQTDISLALGLYEEKVNILIPGRGSFWSDRGKDNLPKSIHNIIVSISGHKKLRLAISGTQIAGGVNLWACGTFC